MRRSRKSLGRAPNPVRDLVSERSRSSELTRARRRDQTASASMGATLPSLIEERVGEQMNRLETKLVEDFREMGQRVVEQSTDAVASQLDGRIAQLEHISVIQSETVNQLRDSSKESEQKVSTVVNTVERALADAIPGFRLDAPSHLPQNLLAAPAARAVAVREGKHYCPKCTSIDVRRANRAGLKDTMLRLFFISPYRCRACRHKFYRF